MASPETGTGAPLRCAAHPGTETYLRCAQCGTPICPRCLVMTPVGAKCPACARSRVHRRFILTPLDVTAAVVVAIVGGSALGIAARILEALPLVSFVVSIFFPFIAGLALAEGVNRVTRNKHDLILRVIAGAGVVVSYLALVVGDFLLRDPSGFLVSGLLPGFLLRGFLDLVVNPINLLFLVIGVWIAFQRV